MSWTIWRARYNASDCPISHAIAVGEPASNTPSFGCQLRSTYSPSVSRDCVPVQPAETKEIVVAHMDEQKKSQPKEASGGPEEEPRIIDSREILGDQVEIMIRHGEELYRLRVTRNGKLILFK